MKNTKGVVLFQKNTQPLHFVLSTNKNNMKGLILSYSMVLAALSITHSNCAKGEKPEQKPQSYNNLPTEVKTETNQILQDSIIFNNQKGVIHIKVLYIYTCVHEVAINMFWKQNQKESYSNFLPTNWQSR
jgi:hypothetical protein